MEAEQSSKRVYEEAISCDSGHGDPADIVVRSRPMLEKRQFKRFILKLPAEVRAGGAHLAGMTVRVSRKGFFDRSQKSFTVGHPSS